MKNDYKMKVALEKIKDLSIEQREDLTNALVKKMLGAKADKLKKYEFESLAEYTEDAKILMQQWGKMQGVSSGFENIDKLTKGFVGGEVTIIAGKTSYGKTMASINIANQVALAGKPVLFVTMEMTKREVASRFMKINDSQPGDYQSVAQLVTMQREDELTWRDVDGLVGNFVKQFDRGLVVIDHLHYFTRQLENTAEDLGRITKEIKKNAIRHDVPVILVSHVRKVGNDQSATMEDLRGSSYIAQDADIVLMVGRDTEDKTIMSLKIEKNRNRGFDYDRSEAYFKLDTIKMIPLEIRR